MIFTKKAAPTFQAGAASKQRKPLSPTAAEPSSLFDFCLDRHSIACDGVLAAHPEILNKFCELAFDYHRQGRRIGARAIVEKLRWAGQFPATGGRFKWANAHTRRLAERAIQKYQQLADTLTTRGRGNQ